MPYYEYKCERCKTIVEKQQRYKDKPLTKCKCGGKLKIIISKNTFKLKKNPGDVGWTRDWQPHR